MQKNKKLKTYDNNFVFINYLNSLRLFLVRFFIWIYNICNCDLSSWVS